MSENEVTSVKLSKHLRNSSQTKFLKSSEIEKSLKKLHLKTEEQNLDKNEIQNTNCEYDNWFPDF